MSLVGKLLGFGLRQVIGVVAGDGVGEIVDKVADPAINFVESHFKDHSQKLPRALEKANDRAWQAVSIALAGDTLLDQMVGFFASGDDKGIREQVRLFLQDKSIGFEEYSDEFRRKCLTELKVAKQKGLLSAQHLTSDELGKQTVSFKRYGDLKGLEDGAAQVMAQIGKELSVEFPDLSRLLRHRPTGGPSLLVSAFAYFFRREVETDDELARGLFFDGLRQLSASQEKAFGEVNKALATLGERFDQLFNQLFEKLDRMESKLGETHSAVLDLGAELQRTSGLHFANAEESRRLFQEVLRRLNEVGMQKGEVKPQHSFSLRSEDERKAVRQLLARFRQMPVEQQKQCPALLNGLGKLQIGSGDFDGARLTFIAVSQTAKDGAAQAEGYYNAYRAALEEKKWTDALTAIQKAASLDSSRFSPFSMQRYQPKQILGAGGFGTAFLCHDHNFNEDVVVKTLHAADMERSMTDVFLEARLLRRLNHPAIIGVHECEYADPIKKLRPYIVMDYFPGSSLATFVQQRGTLSPTWIVDVARQIALGMQAAHQQSILHRDLKPDNVLVRKEGDVWKVKIIDFGLAFRQQTIETSVAGGSSGNTIFGDSVAGTIKYAPPEQMGELKGVRPGPYSDVYSFGKLCCYALFKTTEPRRRQWSELPEALAEMLEQCTEPELAFRLPTFEGVLRVLQPLPKPPIPEKTGKDQWGFKLGTSRAKANAVLAAADKPLSMKELMLAAGTGDYQYYTHMKEMIAEGHVKKTPDGKYQLANKTFETNKGIGTKVSAKDKSGEKPKPVPAKPAGISPLPKSGNGAEVGEQNESERFQDDEAQEAYTFLVITKPEYTPERVENGEVSWSCGKDTRQGDIIFVYVTGEGIRYKWRAVTDAEPDATWRYVCDVAFESTIDPAIGIQEIKGAISNEEWGAPFVNFRGFRTIRIPNAVVPKLLALRK